MPPAGFHAASTGEVTRTFTPWIVLTPAFLTVYLTRTLLPGASDRGTMLLLRRTDSPKQVGREPCAVVAAAASTKTSAASHHATRAMGVDCNLSPFVWLRSCM